MQYYTCETECPGSSLPVPSSYAGCTSAEAHSTQLKVKWFFHPSDPHLTQHMPKSSQRQPL